MTTGRWEKGMQNQIKTLSWLELEITGCHKDGTILMNMTEEDWSKVLYYSILRRVNTTDKVSLQMDCVF